MDKRASRLLKGLIIKFEIEDPDKLDNEKPRNAKVSHRNPVLRLDAGRMWDTIKHTAVFKKPMFWGIKITVFFSGENGIFEELITITPEDRVTIDDINELCIDEIIECRSLVSSKNEGTYSHCFFEIECLGY